MGIVFHFLVASILYVLIKIAITFSNSWPLRFLQILVHRDKC